MVKFKRKFRKNTRRFKTKSKLQQVANLAQRALRQANKVKGMVNVEYKNHDVITSTQTVSTGGAIVQLTNIGSGDGANSRDGRDITIKRITWRYFAVQAALAVVTYLRVILVLDKQTNEAIYTASDLLADVTANNAINSPLNLDNKKRFRILYDKVHLLNDVFLNGIRPVKYNKDTTIKLTFDASTPSIADITSNSLSIFLISSETTELPTIFSYCRLRFIDN